MLRPGVLRKQSDFQAVYNKGRSAGSKYIVLFGKPNGLEYRRVAFLASKKVGNSVERNRARRLMRESYRSLCDQLPQGYDFIFIARGSILDSKCADVKKSIEAAAKRIGVLNQ